MYQWKWFYCNKINYMHLYEKYFSFMAFMPKMKKKNRKLSDNWIKYDTHKLQSISSFSQ